MSGSPSSMTRTWGQSGWGSSLESIPGIQYWRIMFPMGVPGPTRQISSFSSDVSIVLSPFPYAIACVLNLKAVFCVACSTLGHVPMTYWTARIR